MRSSRSFSVRDYTAKSPMFRLALVPNRHRICANHTPDRSASPDSRETRAAMLLSGVNHREEQAKASGISTTIETCGFGPTERFVSLVPFVDLSLWDIKDTDSARHLANTGAPLDPILHNLREVDRAGGTTILRCLLLQGVNLEQTHLDRIAAINSNLSNCKGIELLSYHPLGDSKQERLGSKQSPINLSASSDAMSAATAYLAKLVGREQIVVPACRDA